MAFQHLPDEYKIGAKRFHRVLDSYYPSVYLTMMSIIQGVALATFVFKLASMYRNSDWLSIFYAASNFVLIIYVWLAYAVASLAYKWVPGWLDSFLPFAIGMLECTMILTVTRPDLWFLAIGFLCIVGTIEHFDVYIHLRQDWFDDFNEFKEEKREQLLYMVELLVGAPIFFLLSYVHTFFDNITAKWILGIFPLAFFLYISYTLSTRWKRGAYKLLNSSDDALQGDQ